MWIRISLYEYGWGEESRGRSGGVLGFLVLKFLFVENEGEWRG